MDNPLGRTCWAFLVQDQQALNRHRVSSFVITSNRAVDEWLSIFDDPILGNSSPDRGA